MVPQVVDAQDIAYPCNKDYTPMLVYRHLHIYTFKVFELESSNKLTRLC